MLIYLFFLFIEDKTDSHNYGKDDEIEENRECELAVCGGVLIGAYAVGVDSNKYHKQRGYRSEDGHYDILEFTSRLTLLNDIEDKDRDIESVDGEYRRNQS